jgi:hypothetical protein
MVPARPTCEFRGTSAYASIDSHKRQVSARTRTREPFLCSQMAVPRRTLVARTTCGRSCSSCSTWSPDHCPGAPSRTTGCVRRVHPPDPVDHGTLACGVQQEVMMLKLKHCQPDSASVLGLPTELQTIFSHLNTLSFSDEPDYPLLEGRLAELAARTAPAEFASFSFGPKADVPQSRSKQSAVNDAGPPATPCPQSTTAPEPFTPKTPHTPVSFMDIDASELEGEGANPGASPDAKMDVVHPGSPALLPVRRCQQRADAPTSDRARLPQAVRSVTVDSAAGTEVCSLNAPSDPLHLFCTRRRRGSAHAVRQRPSARHGRPSLLRRRAPPRGPPTQRRRRWQSRPRARHRAPLPALPQRRPRRLWRAMVSSARPGALS